jgi:diguanylate cyclase (GGDEF)-like protein
MLYIVLLILLDILLYILVKKTSYKSYLEKKSNYERQASEYDKLTQENYRLKRVNDDLARHVQDTMALFDITKDICKTLDEDKIFVIFKDYLNRFIKIKDCQFLKEGARLLEFKDYTMLPLTIDKYSVGYLVASGIEKDDEDKFQILAKQFLVGIRRARLYQRVSELAVTDSLTQTFSRRYFLEKLAQELERSKKFKLECSFLMVDLDHFKSFNDNYGHLVGDAILREVANIIKENIRQIDFMCRYGGEELAIILTETDKEQAHFAAERIRKSIESKRLSVYDEGLKATLSIGISTFPEDASEVSGLIDTADKALYLAKETGRNKVCLFES